MKHILFLICFLFLVLFSNKVFATDFIEGFEDVPLMTDFYQIESQNFSFGNEESGYTEAVLTTSKRKDFNDVKSFYLSIMPTFGWQLKEETAKNIVFMRENDVLEILQEQIHPLKILINLKSKN